MTCKKVDRMYKSTIKSKQIINNKTGDVKLEEFDVNVDGYKNRKKLREAKESYNSDKKIKTEYKRDEWPKGIWYYLFGEYYNRLRNRKNKS